jgi:hypothetical protein
MKKIFDHLTNELIYILHKYALFIAVGLLILLGILSGGVGTTNPEDDDRPLFEDDSYTT